MSGKNAAFEKVYTSGDFPINIHKFQFTKTQIQIAQRHWHKSLEIGYHENTHCEIRVSRRDRASRATEARQSTATQDQRALASA